MSIRWYRTIYWLMTPKNRDTGWLRCLFGPACTCDGTARHDPRYRSVSVCPWKTGDSWNRFRQKSSFGSNESYIWHRRRRIPQHRSILDEFQISLLRSFIQYLLLSNYNNKAGFPVWYRKPKPTNIWISHILAREILIKPGWVTNRIKDSSLNN